MSIPFSFHPGLIVRTPRFPYTDNIHDAKADELVKDNDFLESIYLASPVLYNECLKYRDGHIKDVKDVQKLKKSLLKYYLRSVSRCTPFGLFSGCSVSTWKEGAAGLVLNEQPQRHTRFDMHYLCALAQHLALQPGIREHLRYFTNNSFYNIGDEIRYVEYKYFYGRRIHQISAVNATDYLDLLLAKSAKGLSIAEMTQLLEGPEIEAEDIRQFIDELISSQLIVSELEPAITGDEFVHQVLRVLKRIWEEKGNDTVLEIIEILESAVAKLKRIDTAAVNDATAYREIMALLDRLNVPYEEGKLFQVDMSRPVLSGGVPQEMSNSLLEAVRVLNRFGAYRNGNANLQSFFKRFYDRYEEKEMPLLEVLDTETGIGYLEAGAQEHVPLVEDIVFSHSPDPTQQYAWSPIEKFLMYKVAASQETGHAPIELKEEEMKFLTNTRFDDLPPSMHLMFRVVDPEKQLLYIENCGGSSSASLLGRFAHSVQGVNELVNDITATEEKLNPDVIFAEIIHLPESRVGNVILHPPFRKYEIPYLAQSSLPPGQQIQVQNLMVSVKRGMIVLRDRVSNKIVVPRLSSAHNFQTNALPVYQFLCDLQLQQQRGAVSFNWGSITYMLRYLPRVQYKNVILSPGTWRLLGSDYAELVKDNNTASASRLIHDFVQKWHLPKLVVLAEGDNELLIDFENETSVTIFLETIKKRPGIEMREFLAPQGNTVTNTRNQLYNNQVVATLIKTEATYKAPVTVKPAADKQVKTAFIPGSEWLYYKIYCGTKSADKILAEAIKPITELLLEKKLIRRFFFIRYTDPLFHIRFRVELAGSTTMGEVCQVINSHLNAFHQSGHIWKIQTDTYNREIERYGAATIGLAEELFYHDSRSVLKILAETWGDEWENIRWLLTMRSVDELLNSFEITAENKVKLTEMLSKSFAREFNADKFLKEQLNAKYRNYRSDIEKIMRSENDESSNLQPLLRILTEQQQQTKQTAAAIREALQTDTVEVPLTELLGSYIHMLVNRITSSKARLHEMVIYDFLHRYYKGVQAQAMQKKKILVTANEPATALQS
jgi:lantibiotic biosynthesis protein